MKPIIWFESAENDLDSIYDFYFKKNPNAAIKIYNLIIDEVQRLEKWPDIAPEEPLGEGKKYTVRSLVTSDGLFKVIYFVTEETVAIVRIWSCRRDPKQLNLF